VLILALLNYMTAGLLYGFAYHKAGAFVVAEGVTSPLGRPEALLQSFSQQFTLSLLCEPRGTFTAGLLVFQSWLCLLFGALIMAQYVTLSPLQSAKQDIMADLTRK
jgi:hypothetical protein